MLGGVSSCTVLFLKKIRLEIGGLSQSPPIITTNFPRKSIVAMMLREGRLKGGLGY